MAVQYGQVAAYHEGPDSEPGLSKWSDGRLAGTEETNISSQRLGGYGSYPQAQERYFVVQKAAYAAKPDYGT
jgi:hypothetical protein